jgi:glycosyltransferase involved in cell wall biosynthesis
LGRLVDLTLFHDNPDGVTADLRGQFPIEASADYPARRGAFDLTLYQMGNSRWHETIYQTLARFPGVVTLHDLNLHHFIADRAARRGDYDLYTREMGYAAGLPGAYRAWAIRAGQASHPLVEMALCERVAQASLGLIAHSEYARKRMAAVAGARPSTLIPMPDMTGGYDGRSRRAQLNLPADALIFASLGQITAARQLPLALAAFARLAQTTPNLYYLLAGEAGDDLDLPGLIAASGAAERVITVGYVNDLTEFIDWLATADIILNLRHPTVGETSAVAMQALAVGRPVLVFDHGAYAELPETAVVKIPPLDEAALFTAMRDLAQSTERRRTLGAAGAAFAAAQHNPTAVARRYADFLGHILDRLARKFGGRA